MVSQRDWLIWVNHSNTLKNEWNPNRPTNHRTNPTTRLQLPISRQQWDNSTTQFLPQWVQAFIRFFMYARRPDNVRLHIIFQPSSSKFLAKISKDRSIRDNQ